MRRVTHVGAVVLEVFTLWLDMSKPPWGEATLLEFVFLFARSIYAGGETPCECFQAEKMMGLRRIRFGGGYSDCYGRHLG